MWKEERTNKTKHTASLKYSPPSILPKAFLISGKPQAKKESPRVYKQEAGNSVNDF